MLSDDDDPKSLGSMTSVRFANRLIGNIGAPLRQLGSTDIDTLEEEEEIVFSSDPLSTMADSGDVVHTEVYALKRYV